MAQPTLLPSAWAATGDKNSIPTSSSTTGVVNWAKGWDSTYSTPLSTGGKAPERADMNGVLNAISLHTLFAQAGGMYAWSSSVTYDKNAIVQGTDGNAYLAVQGSNTNHDPVSDTAGTWWQRLAGVPFTGATVSAAGATGIVPAPAAGDQVKYLSGDGTWKLADIALSSSATTPVSNATVKAGLDGKLDLSGGTMTGSIYNTAIIRNSDDSFTDIYGGNGNGHGAQYTAFGKNHSGNPGEFLIYADNGSTSRVLVGKPDGSLVWDGCSVIRCSGESGSHDDGYIRYSNGLQICWGTFIHSTCTTPSTHNYPVAFTNGPHPIVSYGDSIGSGSEPLWVVAHGNNSYFTVATYNTGGVRVNYIVAGWWI